MIRRVAIYSPIWVAITRPVSVILLSSPLGEGFRPFVFSGRSPGRCYLLLSRGPGARRVSIKSVNDRVHFRRPQPNQSVWRSLSGGRRSSQRSHAKSSVDDLGAGPPSRLTTGFTSVAL